MTETASLSMLDGTAWVLRKLDGREGKALPGQATLAFASGKVSGSTGCNPGRWDPDSGEAAAARGARLVAVKVFEDTGAQGGSGLVVVAGRGVRIEVARDFDTGTLARVPMTSGWAA